MSAEFFIELLALLISVESGGDVNAVGDNGMAYGQLQIHPGYIECVNRIAGTSFTHKDAFHPVKSRYMTVVYIRHYGARYKRITGREPTMEVLARIHNGGPDGWKKESTDVYWNKVKRLLK